MYCIDLSSASDTAQVGGKAANLAKAISLGMSVPAGFVLVRDALMLYLKETGLLTRARELFEARDGLARERQKEWFRELRLAALAVPLPRALETEITAWAEELFEFATAGLAVRSSGVCEDAEKASFAGVYESFLCVSSIEELWDSIRRCWCSFWNPQALDYATKMGFDLEPDQMAVIVQATVQADSAGVLFTADPLTGNPWRFVLNSTFGLAQDLVGGNAPADRFVLEWDTGQIMERTIAEKKTSLVADRSGVKKIVLQDGRQGAASLSGEMVAKIGQMGLDLDRAFGLRVDIEWAVTNQDVHLVQVRPITALPSFFPHELNSADAKLTWTLSDPAWYTSVNEGERLVAPLFRDVWMLELSERYHVPGDICFRPQRVGQERDFNGYRYSTEWTWKTSGEDIEPKVQWLNNHETELKTAWSLQKEDIFRVCGEAAKAQKDVCRAADAIPNLVSFYEQEIQMWGSIGMSAAQWMFFTCYHLLDMFLNGIASDVSSKDLLIGFPSYSHERTAAAQALGHSVQEEHVRLAFLQKPLAEVIPYLLGFHPECQFLKDYERFCWRFGVRPPNWSIQWGRWCQDPTQTLFAVKNSVLGLGRDVQEALDKAAEAREVRAEKIRGHVCQFDPSLLSRFEDMLRWAKFWVPALDDRKWHWVMNMRLADLMQCTGTMLAEEGLLDDADDILLLTKEDLARISDADDVRKHRELYLTRKREYERNRRLAPPSYLGTPAVSQTSSIAQQEPEIEDSSEAKQGRVFKGWGLSPGHVTGISRKLADLSDLSSLDSLSSEHILVCPAFSGWPDWLSLFMVIRGLVTVRSTQLHHALQIARECGVPYINLPEDDFASIPDSARVALDSATGMVTVLE